MKPPALFKRFKTLLRNTSHRSRQAASAEVDTRSTDHTPTSTAQFTGAIQVTGSGEIAGHVASESRDPACEKVESTCSTSTDGCEVIVTAPQMQKELKFNAPFSAEFPLGCLGRFQIKERLGNGLHGRVFRAFDPGLDREVAIKVINPTHQATELALIAEARRTSTSHPNLVHIHEVRCVTVDEVDVHFLVLDLIKGSTLNERMSQPISVSQAVEWIKQIASGLAAMHRRGIPHLDVQPKNIMVRDLDNQAVVIDIGLEREIKSDGVVRAIGGTPAYLSPEQCLGQHVDHRSDIFSLGILMYRLLAAHMPFRGDKTRLIWEITRLDPAPLSDHCPRLSITLQAIVLKCLQKLPELRYQTADELLEDIGSWQQNLPTRAREVSLVERAGLFLRRHRIAAVLVSCLLMLTTLSVASALRLRYESQRTADALHDTRLLLGKNLRAAVAFRGRASGLEQQLLLDAEPYYRKVLQEAGSSSDKLAEVAEANLQLAFSLWGSNQSEEARKFLKVAEGQFETLDRTDATDDELRLLSVFYMDRVPLYKELQLPLSPAAELDSYRQALDRAWQLSERNPRSSVNRLQLAHAHINLAAAWQSQNQYPSAREHRQRGIELLRQSAHDSEDESRKGQLAEVLQNQSALLIMLGLPKEAEACQSEARELWSSLRQIDQYSIVRFDRLLADGDELLLHGSYKEADQTWREALAVCQTMLARSSTLDSFRAWVNQTLIVCDQLTILDAHYRDAQLDYRSTLAAVDQLHALLEGQISSGQLDNDARSSLMYQLAQAKGIRVTIRREHKLGFFSDLESITLQWSALYGGPENRVLLAREYAVADQVDQALAMLQSFQASDNKSAKLKFDEACVYSLCAESLTDTAPVDETRQSRATQLARQAIDLLKSKAVLELIEQEDFATQLAGDLRWIAANYPSDIHEINISAGRRP